MFFRRGANLSARRDAVCREEQRGDISLLFSTRARRDESSKRRSAEALCRKISLNKPSLIYRRINIFKSTTAVSASELK